MRLFIALSFDDNVKDALVQVQNEMYAKGIRGNYTSYDNLHVTLAFIGDYPEPLDILDVMEDIPFDGFDLTLNGIGNFGDTWYAGIDDNQELRSYVNMLRGALREKGIRFDSKAFRPHVTLIRKPRGDLGSLISSSIHKDVHVGHVSLMKSVLRREGPIYTEIGCVYE